MDVIAHLREVRVPIDERPNKGLDGRLVDAARTAHRHEETPRPFERVITVVTFPNIRTYEEDPTRGVKTKKKLLEVTGEIDLLLGREEDGAHARDTTPRSEIRPNGGNLDEH